MIIWPLRALSGTPLTSILTVSSLMGLCRRRVGCRGCRVTVDDGAALVLDHVLKLMPEVLQETLHRPRGGIAQRADGVALDAIGDVQQQPEILASPLAGDDSLQHAVEPSRAFAAGCALTAGLRHVKARQALQRAHHARRLVHDDDGAGAER